MVNVALRVQGVKELVGGFTVLPEVMAAENQKAMVLATHVAESEIKALTPRKTGRLQAAWFPETRGTGFATVGIVGDPVSYGAAIEEGAKAHPITAHGNALMVPVASGGGFGGGRLSGAAAVDQQVAFFKKVNHPATSGKHMAKRGLASARPEIVLIFSRAAEQAIKISLGKLRTLGSTFIGRT